MVKDNDTAPQASVLSRPPERYLDRDLSWLKFNDRVLDQVGKPERTIFERLTFLHISASNLDEFFMVRIGRLYKYIDCGRMWHNKLGVPPLLFRDQLLQAAKVSFCKHHEYFLEKVKPSCEVNHFSFVQNIAALSPQEQGALKYYFKETILPMLTPVVFDQAQALPVFKNKALVFGVVTHDPAVKEKNKQITFVQLPHNLSRFYRFSRSYSTFFVSIEEVVRTYLSMLFSNIAILSVTLFRVIRDGNFSLEGGNGTEVTLVEELKRKLKARNQGRIVRLEIEENHDPWLLDILKHHCNIDQGHVFTVPGQSLVDLTGLQQLAQQSHARQRLPVPPISCPSQCDGDLFEVLKQQDILLHHPYNSMDIEIDFLERAAEDPYVLAIQLTIYRLAQDSAVVAALCKAAANGKQVSVLMEIKARFDEVYNMRQAQRLRQAGCLVSYGKNNIKTHAKMMMIVRREEDGVVRYVHLSSGNYNEETAKQYADVSLMTTDTTYADDVARFFDAITGHSASKTYENIIATPLCIRDVLTSMISQEIQNAQQGFSCGIVIKVNALEDEATIEALYKASQAGVPVRLIIRGICCLIPQRPGLSTNIQVRSIVGNFLEHARIFYFHNQGNAKVYAGSADIMVRSFDKRIESLFLIKDPILKQQVTNILAYDLRDNINSYLMREDGTYAKIRPGDAAPFDMHKEFFELTLEEVMRAQLFA